MGWRIFNIKNHLFLLYKIWQFLKMIERQIYQSNPIYPKIFPFECTHQRKSHLIREFPNIGEGKVQWHQFYSHLFWFKVAQLWFPHKTAGRGKLLIEPKMQEDVNTKQKKEKLTKILTIMVIMWQCKMWAGTTS